MINKSVDDFIDQYKALTNDQIVSYIILSSKIAENFIIDVKKIKKEDHFFYFKYCCNILEGYFFYNEL